MVYKNWPCKDELPTLDISPFDQVSLLEKAGGLFFLWLASKESTRSEGLERFLLRLANSKS
jgi:hypothetical protein